MPRTISEIREFVPRNYANNIKEDPARNSVIGNVKKLHDVLGEYDDFASRTLRGHLENIMNAHEGKIEEAAGNDTIKSLNGSLHAVYLLKIGGLDNIKDEKKRGEMKNLIEYVAGGLQLKSDIPVSEDQKLNLDHMEKMGKIEVRSEKAEAEAQARRDAVKGKSGLNLLDEHKARISALAKSFKGAGADIHEAAARQQLKGICLDIMATRRTIDAKRNDKSGLSKATVDADLLHSIKNDMVKNKAIDNFLNSMSYKDLRALASSGHGGEMEDKFKDYLKNAEAVPEDAPQQYMPTAKERVEALQAKMNTQSFRKQSTPGEQRKLYVELMAARAAVGSRRGSKDSLNPVVDAKALDQERKLFSKEPLQTALVRVTAMGDKQEAACEAALSGHGGALEDLVRRELRVMALEKENGYKMQNVDFRYAPTYDQRKQDLDGLMNSKSLSDADRFRVAIERGILEEMQGERKGDEKVSGIDSLNSQVETKMALYKKVMKGNEMREFAENARTMGYENACRAVEAAHNGELKLIQMREDLDRQLAAGPDKDDLPKLSAQKMKMLEYGMNFAQDRNDEKLAQALDKDNFDKSVNKFMTADYNFKGMCKKLGSEGLLAQAQGTGFKLIDSYNLEKEDKLQPYKPEAPAAAKKGPDKNHVKEQQGGPQIGA